MARHGEGRGDVARALAVAAAVVAMVVVVVVDITTGLWQDVVILSGVVAGLLTFILTALFLDRVLARSQHARWLPVTRLALTDIAHSLADDARSEITRGRIVPRSIPVPAADDATPAPGAVDDLLRQVVAERALIAATMGRWSAFLAASGDVRTLMLHIAGVAERLDAIRDTALEIESGRAGAGPAHLGEMIEAYNAAVAAATEETMSLLQR